MDNGDNNNPTAGSLRAAIIAANNHPGSTINFNASYDVKLAAQLPDITANGTTIDGSAGFGQTAQIDGQNAGNIAGLTLDGNNCTVTGLGIVRCEAAGILVQGAGDVVSYCDIGTDDFDDPGLGDGVGVNVYDASNVTLQSNDIEYNTADGVQVNNSGGVVIGGGQAGNTFEHNSDDGIRVLGGTLNAGQSFVTKIDDNITNVNGGNGIHLVNSSYNVIGQTQYNVIGDDGDMGEQNGNGGDGLLIESINGGSSINNTIADNYIVGNAGNGVRLTGPGTSYNTLTNNEIGRGIHIVINENIQYFYHGNRLDGVAITGGANNNQVGGKGLWLYLTPANGAGNLIVDNGEAGVGLSDPGTILNFVQGNLIGTDFTGTMAQGNQADGVLIANGASHNQIGGLGGTRTQSGEGNLISGNLAAGVDLRDSGTSENVITDNLIGTDVTGAVKLGNLEGVVILPGASGNKVGSAYPGLGKAYGNVISGNTLTGVLVLGSTTTGNVIQANDIGTNLAGSPTLGNGANGVLIVGGANGNIVGGANLPEFSYLPGNVISGNHQNGVEIAGSGTNNNVVSGNLIGTDPSGVNPLPNSLDGVLVTLDAAGNIIGGANALSLGNAVSANMMSGVVINQSATNNTVQGNTIGTNSIALPALGNGQDGVDLESSNNTLTDNVISGNFATGVVVAGSDNLIQSNKIGTNSLGTQAVPNDQDGVFMSVTIGPGGNTLGGTTTGAGNVISGNVWNGIDIAGPASAGNLIEGNDVGTNGGGTKAIGNGRDGVLVQNATGYTIGGSVPRSGNLISGNVRDGIDIVGAGSTNLVVLGNKIGTDVSGQFAIGNALNGVHIEMGASFNVIGGTVPADGNLISGNDADGILIDGTTNVLNGGPPTQFNLLLGNKIGTNVFGNAPLANLGQGVQLVSTSNNVVGGDVAGAGNLISGNTLDGVQITDGSSANVVQGNLIGTAINGTTALPNGANGVDLLQAANNNVIGGVPTATSTPGNVISGNKLAGVRISDTGTSSNVVEGNYIGTTRSGAAALGNKTDGVDILNGATSNQIGATGGAELAGAGNIISGNAGNGVDILGTGTSANLVQGNSIGTYSSGQVSKGNGFDGVLVAKGAQNNLIGGLAANAGNVIANNGYAGVAIGSDPTDKSTVSNPILSNSIHGNAGLGIDLGSSGVVLPNTPGSPHVGPNDLQSTPVIASAKYNGTSTVVRVLLNSIPNLMFGFTIQIFANPTRDSSGYGQGQTLVATVLNLSTDATGNLVGGYFDVPVPSDLAGQYLSATATDSFGNTSEFGQDYLAS